MELLHLKGGWTRRKHFRAEDVNYLYLLSKRNEMILLERKAALQVGNSWSVSRCFTVTALLGYVVHEIIFIIFT